jgi:hypothetical protein
VGPERKPGSPIFGVHLDYLPRGERHHKDAGRPYSLLELLHVLPGRHGLQTAISRESRPPGLDKLEKLLEGRRGGYSLGIVQIPRGPPRGSAGVLPGSELQEILD